ncbi:helicase associated domain-containing protein [Streptomyces sp. 2131.1]|uniref:helicase associated domain-containing protein n=1 Tax=Streptomyces sp. 2131.1 TaxID=1855346 RepID=UPI00352684EE
MIAKWERFNVISTERQDWQRGYEAARRYCEREGDLEVPYEHTEGAYPLGRWLSDQRRSFRAGTMNGERADELEELGMVWDTADAAFLQHSQDPQHVRPCRVHRAGRVRLPPPRRHQLAAFAERRSATRPPAGLRRASGAGTRCSPPLQGGEKKGYDNAPFRPDQPLCPVPATGHQRGIPRGIRRGRRRTLPGPGRRGARRPARMARTVRRAGGAGHRAHRGLLRCAGTEHGQHAKAPLVHGLTVLGNHPCPGETGPPRTGPTGRGSLFGSLPAANGPALPGPLVR